MQIKSLSGRSSHTSVHCSIIYNSQAQKQLYISHFLIHSFIFIHVHTHTHNALLFIHNKEGKSCHLWQNRWNLRALCKLEQVRKIKYYVVTYMWNLIKTELIENRFVVARGRVWEWGQWVKVVKSYKFPVIRGINSRGVMHSMMTIINNSVPFTWKLLRVDLKNPQHNNKKNFCYYVKLSMLPKFIVVIILQYIHRWPQLMIFQLYEDVKAISSSRNIL